MCLIFCIVFHSDRYVVCSGYCLQLLTCMTIPYNIFSCHQLVRSINLYGAFGRLMGIGIGNRNEGYRNGNEKYHTLPICDTKAIY